MKATWLIEGLVIGALGMYFLDPDKGTRRRNELRDRAKSRIRHAGDSISVMTRDFANRAKGAQAQLSHLRNQEEVSSEVVGERLRSSLGRCVTHPGSLIVEASNGDVWLRGDILANEVEEAVHCAKRIAKGKKVHNLLHTHSKSENYPGLQGEGHTTNPSGRWTPATCLTMGVLGIGLAGYGAARRGILGMVYGILGTGMIAKGFADTENRHQPGANSHPAQPLRRKATTGEPVAVGRIEEA